MSALRRLLCGHNETEMWRESDVLPNGVTVTRTTRHVCTRCGKDLVGAGRRSA